MLLGCLGSGWCQQEADPAAEYPYCAANPWTWDVKVQMWKEDGAGRLPYCSVAAAVICESKQRRAP